MMQSVFEVARDLKTLEEEGRFRLFSYAIELSLAPNFHTATKLYGNLRNKDVARLILDELARRKKE